MLSLTALICYNCEANGSSQLFFDLKRRRPCVGVCGHSVCAECVSKDPYLQCPICERNDAFVDGQINNSAEVLIVEWAADEVVHIYEEWWNGDNVGKGSCSSCSAYTNHLRICETCELCEVAWKRCLWKNPSEFTILNEHRLLYFALRVYCSDCVLMAHSGHQTLKLRDVRNANEEIRRTLANIANAHQVPQSAVVRVSSNLPQCVFVYSVVAEQEEEQL
ncbi:unnamed protein product [Caenorhabditis sp. 36 PRJEB53466]|nr:unnamed protein product [Caenorhabditis sp. 36 PRJEB53466]